jgi:outer membrane protein assembly factor BamC
MNFTVSDRDRTKGWFLVKYLDPTYEAEKKREQGFFTNLFSQTKTVEPPTYQIKLTDEGNQTRVTVLNANGGPDTTGVAPKILTLLGEQTR